MVFFCFFSIEVLRCRDDFNQTKLNEQFAGVSCTHLLRLGVLVQDGYPETKLMRQNAKHTNREVFDPLVFHRPSSKHEEEP